MHAGAQEGLAGPSPGQLRRMWMWGSVRQAGIVDVDSMVLGGSRQARAAPYGGSWGTLAARTHVQQG